MNLQEITKPITAQSLNETLAKRFGKKLNVQQFTSEQLEDARNKLRTQLSAIETNESFDDVHSNDTYQKSKLMLDVLNAEISERSNIVGEEKKPDKDGDGVPDWADKKPGEDDHAKKDSKSGKGLSAKQKKLPKGLQKAIAKKKTNEGKYEYFDDKATAQAHAEKHGGKVYTNSGKGNAGGKNTHVVIKDLKEGKEDEAELVMASKDMVDRVTSWMEDTAEMQTESMLELGDKIRDEMGIDKSEEFIGTVKPALGSLFTALESTRDSLTSGVAILTGEGAPSTMGDEVPADDTDMEPTVDADAEAEAPEGDDEFAAADASVGGDEPDDRGKRESIELSKRLGLLLADSKKKD